MNRIFRRLAFGLRDARRRLGDNWRLARRPDRAGVPGFPWGRALTLLAIAIALVVLLALAADARVMQAMQGMPGWFRGFFGKITHVGKSDWVLIPSGVLVLVIASGDWSRASRRHAAAWAEIAAFAATLFLVVAASGLFTDLLKAAFGRMRPPYADGSVLDFAPFMFGGYRNYSFPSGHSTVMGALAVVIATGPRAWRVAGLVVVVAVACSRFVIGVHYPSDVMAGLTIGAVISWMIVHRMARGGFGFAFRPDGSIAWRLTNLGHLRARGGWVAALIPPLWIALAPSPMPRREPSGHEPDRRPGGSGLRAPSRGAESIRPPTARMSGGRDR